MLKEGERTFTQARKTVLRSLQSIQGLIGDEDASRRSYEKNWYHLWIYSSIPLSCAVVFIVCGALHSLTSPVIVGCALFVICAGNALVILRSTKEEDRELSKEIQTITDAYRRDIEETATIAKEDDRHDVNAGRKFEGVEQILAGNPHISIVTCYRNQEWQRLPTLLLTEGDVIALMAGDITPCKVYELSPIRLNGSTSSRPTPPSSSSPTSRTNDLISLGNSLWQKGSLVQSGVKIHLRKNASKWTEEKQERQQQQPSTSHFAPKQKRSYERHRSVPSESTELLSLSGDVRCFFVTENPIESFGNKLMLESTIPRSSLLSSICRALDGTAVQVEEGKNGEESYIRKLFVTTVKEMMHLMIWLLIIFLIASLGRCIFMGTVHTWCISVLMPAAVVPLCFSFISLPLGMLFVESVALSNILSKAEALLQEEAFDVVTSGNSNASGFSKAVLTANLRARDSSGSENNSTYKDEKDEIKDTDKSSSDGDFDDEDEDLDKRALENSVEASHRIQFKRKLKYAVHIFCSRLGIFERWRQATNDLLPIPMSKLRLLEVLGSVTMICFIDDDVICEDFSVTEEIFLLQSTGNSEVKTKVLDLHANPEATGSRFENPQWFTYLPSLKPIGLNAVLTYSPFPPRKKMIDYGRDERIFEFEGKNFTVNEKFDMPSSLSLVADQSKSSSVGTHGTTAWTSLKDYGTMNKSKSRSRKNQVEVALVDHVRKCMPLKTLKELAEEIGFVEEDYMGYSRLLEMNVIAPRLCDLKMMEDTHAWGQEETRRRGTLATQVRGVLVKDSRGGGLQMMSQGDPSLILNYSKEYWDGINITPLTIADRTEVLKVYDRWDLEDYDVVGFSYTPVPFHLHNTIMDAYGENPVRLDSKSNSEAAGVIPEKCDETYMSPQENSMFFVDPRSERDLLPKYKAKSTRTAESYDNKSEKDEPEEMDAAEVDDLIAKGNRPRANSVHSAYSSASQSPRRRSSTSGSTRSSPTKVPYQVEKDNDDMTSTGLQKSTSENCLYTLRQEIHYVRDVYSNCDLHGLIEEEDNKREGISEDDREFQGEEDGQCSVEGSEEGEILVDDVDEDAPVDDVDIQVTRDEEVRTRTSTAASHDRLSLEEDLSDSIDRAENSEGALLEPYKATSERILSTKSFLEQEGLSDRSDINSQFQRQPASRESFSNGKDSSKGPKQFDGGSDENDNDLIESTIGNNSWMEDDHSTGLDYPDEPLNESINEKMLRSISTSEKLTRSVSLDGAFSLGELTSADIGVFPLDDDEGSPLDPSLHDYQTDELATSKHDPKSKEMRKSSLTALDVGKNFNRIQSSKTLGISHDQGSAPTNTIDMKRSLAASLWPLMRQQVFLGMAASYVPVKPEAPELVEDLTSAGIRFVYFSPRNMRRSKPLANKLGLETDWNCAISLRPLEGKAHDPHRMTSTKYTDWDVMAQMPHGVEAIKEHLYGVDNVPLLVSLYTDATADTVNQMVNVFRGFGEIVMTIGSGYREANRNVFRDSDAAISVSMLPGNAMQIPLQARAVSESFPVDSSAENVCRSDINLVLSLIGIGTLPFLQLPSSYNDGQEIALEDDGDEILPVQIRLKKMLESIRDGRIILLNMFQILGMTVLSSVSLAMWQLTALAMPVQTSPTLPPALAILFVMVYIPCITISMLFSPSNEMVMKNTPRKNSLDVRPRDKERFVFILCARVSLVLISSFIVGWVAAVDALKGSELKFEYFVQFHGAEADTRSCSYSNGGIEHVQDVVSFAILLNLILQASSMLYRGQKMVDLPSPRSCPVFYLMSVLILLVHVVAMFIRASLRDTGVERYSNMPMIVYMLLLVLPLLCAFLVYPLNEYDDNHYRRYLNFLRLEFDTRLGMHSPR